MNAILQIFRLEPKVGGLDFSDKEPENSAMEELSAQQRTGKMRDELTNLYGTKRSINEVIPHCLLSRNLDIMLFEIKLSLLRSISLLK